MPKAPGISRRGTLAQQHFPTSTSGSITISTAYGAGAITPVDGDIMLLSVAHRGSSADNAVGVDGDDRGFRNDGGYYPASTTNMTVMFWLKIDSNTSVATRSIWDYGPDNWGTQPSWWIGCRGTGAPVIKVVADADPSDASEQIIYSSTLTTARWYHLAYVKSGDTHTVYRDGVPDAIITYAMPAVSDWSGITNSLLGAPSGEQGDWNVGRFRQWDVALTQAEVNTEMNSQTAVKTAGLFRAHDLTAVDGTDASGNSRPMTVVNGAGMSVATGPGITPVWVGGLSAWTAIAQEACGPQRLEVFWKRASSEPASYTITGTGSTARACLMKYSGMVPSGSPINVVVTAVNECIGTDPTAGPSQPSYLYDYWQLHPGLTTTEPNEMVVFIECAGDQGTLTQLTAFSDPLTPNRHEDLSLYHYTDVKRSSGSTVQGSLTIYDGIKIWEGFTGLIGADYHDWTTRPYIIVGFSCLPDTTTATAGTRYYLTAHHPSFHATDEWLTPAGTWAHDWGGPRAFVPGDIYPLQLSQVKAGGGRIQSAARLTTDVTGAGVLMQQVLTPPLAAQTIDSTFDLLMASSIVASDASGFANAGATPDSTAAWRVHMYVTVGNSRAVRHVLLDNWVDPVTWAWPKNSTKWRGLSAPVDIGPYTIQEGDRIVIEYGAHLVASTPYPVDVYEPVNYQSVRHHRGVHVAVDDSVLHQSMVPGYDAFTTTDYSDLTAEACAFFSFSQTLTEVAESDTPPANSTWATAETITTLPYQSDVLLTHFIDEPVRPLWFTWTAPSDMRVYAHVIGTQGYVSLYVRRAADVADGPLYPPGLVWEDNEASFSGKSGACCCWDATSGETYAIWAFTCIDYHMSPASGAAVRLSLFEEIPLANNDIIIGFDYFARYTTDGLLAALRPANPGVTGLAIDYSELPVTDAFNGDGTSTHTAHRLLSADFFDTAVYVWDLATLNADGNNLDYIYEPFHAGRSRVSYVALNQNGDPSLDDSVFAQSSLAALPDGTIYVGNWGDGFKQVAGVDASYMNQLAEYGTARMVRSHVQHGDNQPAYPYPAGVRSDLALDAGGINYVELNPAGTEIWYTSAGWYTPIGGQIIKRWDIVNDVQLPDFATVPVGPGPNPGLKGLFPLPVTPTTPTGGVLVCNGGEVVHYDGSGTLVATYVPDPAGQAVSLADVELQADGAAFVVFDEGTMWLTKFDMATGLQLWSIPTYFQSGNATSLVIYRATAYPTIDAGIVGSGGIVFGGYAGTGFIPATGYEIAGSGGIIFGGRSPISREPIEQRRVWPCPIDEQIAGGCPPSDCLSPCLSPDVVRLDLLE